MARTKRANVTSSSEEEVSHGSPGNVPPRKQYTCKVRAKAGTKGASPKKKAPEKRKLTAAEKGKGKLQPSHMDKRPLIQDAGSETESEEAEVRAAMAASRQNPPLKRPRTGNTSSVPTAGIPVIPENNLRFLEGKLDEGVDRVTYSRHFRERGFCPAVSVNFQELKNDPKVNLDLTGILGRYEGWLSRTDEYSPDVVR